MSAAQRRSFLFASSALLAAPLTSFAQPAQKVRRIGFLLPGAADSLAASLAQQRLRDSLKRIGYEEGRNLVIEKRYANDKLESLPALAQGLVDLKVELIVAAFNQPIAAARQATRTIPIVMLSVVDPVENGYVESLAHPGGNVTGTMWSGPELGGKLLQLLKEAAPSAVRVAILSNPSRGSEAWISETRRAAKLLAMSIQEYQIPRVEDVVTALDRIAAGGSEALIVLGDTNSNSRAGEIAAFATRRKLPSIGSSSIYLAAGGLIFYGPDILHMFDRTAYFVDRILRGAKPSDLPVEGPTKYELVLNMKSARAMGVKFTESFMVRVDRVIE